MNNLNPAIKTHAEKTFTALSLTVVIVLYLAHALPLYFYNVALPAILRHQGWTCVGLACCRFCIFLGRLNSFGRP